LSKPRTVLTIAQYRQANQESSGAGDYYHANPNFYKQSTLPKDPGSNNKS
jgi:hypothetical protein